MKWSAFFRFCQYMKWSAFSHWYLSDGFWIDWNGEGLRFLIHDISRVQSSNRSQSSSRDRSNSRAHSSHRVHLGSSVEFSSRARSSRRAQSSHRAQSSSRAQSIKRVQSSSWAQSISRVQYIRQIQYSSRVESSIRFKFSSRVYSSIGLQWGTKEWKEIEVDCFRKPKIPSSRALSLYKEASERKGVVCLLNRKKFKREESLWWLSIEKFKLVVGTKRAYPTTRQASSPIDFPCFSSLQARVLKSFVLIPSVSQSRISVLTSFQLHFEYA